LITAAILLMLVMKWTVGITRRMRDQDTEWTSSRSR